MRKTLYIASPSIEGFDGEYIARLLIATKPQATSWGYTKRQAVDVARNALTSAFKNQTMYDFFLMIDADATYHQEAIMRLMERNVPAVCGVFFNKQFPPAPMMGKYNDLSPAGRHTYHFGYTMQALNKHIDENEPFYEKDNNNLVLPKRPDDLLPIDGCGMHFTLIRRDVIEAISEPFFQCTSPGAGEDFYFCRKVREAGFPIYADLSVYCGHGNELNMGISQYAFYRNKIDRDGEVWEV